VKPGTIKFPDNPDRAHLSYHLTEKQKTLVYRLSVLAILIGLLTGVWMLSTGLPSAIQNNSSNVLYLDRLG
jgi:hypothetical protein